MHFCVCNKHKNCIMLNIPKVNEGKMQHGKDAEASLGFSLKLKLRITVSL